MWVAIALFLASLIILLCVPFGSRVPWNNLFLLFFTLSIAYIVSCACSNTAQTEGKHIVFIAAIMILAITISATFYVFLKDKNLL